MAANSVYNLREFSYSDILKRNKELSNTVKGKDLTVDILSNITVNPVKEILELYIRSLSLNPVIRFGNYDNIVQDSFALQETDMVIVFYELINITENFHLQAELLGAEEVHEIIEKGKTDIDLIFANLASKPLVLFNKFSSRPFTGAHHAHRNLDVIAHELNLHLAAQKPGNVQLIDLDRILSEVSVREALDKKKFIKYKSLYKIEFLKWYVCALENAILRRTGKLKKALIFDCDNTLWKGVIGEDGPQGIDMSAKSETGIHYHLVQKIAVELSRKGILICLCSKNNPAEVEGLLGKHPDMVLDHDHIVSMKVNWTNKDENLRMLAEELNIGLDSFVFIDDSDFEVNLIRTNVPEVLTIAVPKDLAQYPDLIMETAQRFFNLEPLKEDLKKVKIYKEQAQRTRAMNSAGNIDDYLATLGTNVVISRDNTEQIARVAQLTQKTNQFNLTTKRYTETDIAGFMHNPKASVFTIDVSDKFGDSGITGVMIVKESPADPSVAEIDSYLLSCRILGRKIEVFFLDHVMAYCRERNYTTVHAKYSKTSKNSQVKDYYKNMQFREEEVTEEETTYALSLEKHKKANIDFIKVTEKQPTN